jgi:hypothetical protein
LGNEKWKKPLLVAESSEPNREDQKNMTDASEYLDDPSVLEEKMEIVAKISLERASVSVHTLEQVFREQLALVTMQPKQRTR